MAICGAVAAVAVIVGGVVFLTPGSPASPGALGASRSGAGRTSSPSPVAAQAAGVTIPSGFAGTWTGTATMAAIGTPGISLQNSITFTLAAGAGTAYENNQSCSNTLTLRKVTATVLTFSEPQTAACVAGTVTFTRHGADLAYIWTDNIEENTATLHRT